MHKYSYAYITKTIYVHIYATTQTYLFISHPKSVIFIKQVNYHNVSSSSSVNLA